MSRGCVWTVILATLRPTHACPRKIASKRSQRWWNECDRLIATLVLQISSAVRIAPLWLKQRMSECATRCTPLPCLEVCNSVHASALSRRSWHALARAHILAWRIATTRNAGRLLLIHGARSAIAQPFVGDQLQTHPPILLESSAVCATMRLLSGIRRACAGPADIALCAPPAWEKF